MTRPQLGRPFVFADAPTAAATTTRVRDATNKLVVSKTVGRHRVRDTATGRVLVTLGLVKKISFPIYCKRTTAARYNIIIKYAQSAGARTEAAHAAAGNRPTGTRDRGGGAASTAAVDLQMLREIIV